VIVGGGPAGSTCAWRLGQAGLRVLVLDRAAFPRQKICAGWVTPQVLEELSLDVSAYADGRVLQPIFGFRTSRIGGPEVVTRYPSPVSYGIRRYEFDAYLLARAGAAVEVGALTDLRRDGEEWVVNGEIRTPLLVGAGGHFCPVARRLGAMGSGAGVVAAQEAEFPLDEAQRRECPVDPELPALYFCADLEGYGWCFRKGDYLNVGFGRRASSGFPSHVRAFWEFLKERRAVPSSTPFPWDGHAYLLYGASPRPVVGDGVVLVGDAAGLAYAESGEGIRPAIESGLLAADAIVAAGGRYRAADLEPYRRSLEARLGPRSRPAASLSVPAPLRNLAGRALLATGWFTRHFVLDRWFLHKDEPPLAPA
jgi:flavin-dependent dehydrogenase